MYKPDFIPDHIDRWELCERRNGTSRIHVHSSGYHTRAESDPEFWVCWYEKAVGNDGNPLLRDDGTTYNMLRVERLNHDQYVDILSRLTVPNMQED